MVDRTTTVRLRLDNSQFDRGLLESARAAGFFANSVESSGSRMETLVQAAIGLGPAVVPVLAAGGVAAAAFATQLAFAATGAGVAMLAFNGVGDAVKKMDAFALAPSATTFAALHLSMEKLGPAQQQFVQFLHDSEPLLHDLQKTAGQNMFPGLESGLQSLKGILPDVTSIVAHTGQALGQMADEAGHAFNNPQWHQFFQFMSTQANTTLVTLGRTIGNFVQGLGSIMVAFGPLTSGFSAGLLDMSRSFATWSAQLGTSGGFQDFIAYVQSIGPQVVSTLAAVGQAILSIAAATAPLQGPTLSVIKALADTLSALASSPIGPLAIGILQVAAAMQTMHRASTWLGTSAIGGLMGAGTTAGVQATGVAMKETAVAAETMGTAVKGAGIASATFGTEVSLMKAQIAELGVAEGTAAAGAARMKIEIAETAVAMASAQASIAKTTTSFREMGVASTMAGGARGALSKLTEPASVSRLKNAALGVGLVATSFSSLDDGLGISNTAQFAMLGTLIEPGFGTAVGAAAGAVADFAAVNNDLTSSLQNAQNAMSDPTAFSLQTQMFGDLSQSIGDLHDKASVFETGLSVVPGGSFIGAMFGDHFNAEADAAAQNLVTLTNEQNHNRQAFSDLTNVMTAHGGEWKDYSKNTERLGQTAAQATPVLQKMGMTLEDVQSAWIMGQGEHATSSWSDFVAQFKATAAAMDSSAGKAQVVGAAISGMNNDLLTAAASAQALGTALSSALDPGLNLSAAQDALAAGLRHFSDNIAKGTRSLTDNTDAADKNRLAFRTQTQAIEQSMVAMANHNAGSKSIAHAFDDQRQALIKTAVAAGFAKKDVVDYLDQVGLTAQLTNAALRHAGIDNLTDQANNLHDAYQKLPKKVQTDIEAKGLPKTNADISALQKKYHLTPKEVHTLVAIKDAASGPLKDVLGKVLKFGNTKGEATLLTRDQASHIIAGAQRVLDVFGRSNADASLTASDHASGTIRSATGAANAFSGTYTATLITQHVIQTSHISDAGGRAAGGYITGPGGPRDDKIPAWLSNGEFVVNAAATSQNLQLLHSINAQTFHVGGLVQGFAKGGHVGRGIDPGDIARRAFHQDDPGTIQELVRALKAMRREAKDVTKAERDLDKARKKSHATTVRINDVERKMNKAKGDEAKRLRELDHKLKAQQREDDKAQQKAEDELSKQRDQLSKATDKWKQKQQQLIDQAKAIEQTILDQGSVFGGQGTSVTVGGMLAKIRSAAKDAQTFQKDIRILRGRGIDETFIQQLLEQGPTPEGLQAAESLAHASKSQIAQLNRYQSRLDRVAQRTGQLGANLHAGEGGVHVTVNLNGKIETTDVHALARELPHHVRRAFKIATHA